ncbi:hypothetical protein JTB14_030030 [Gonioctena quinquepunctata]|nr:hypothetical protein JTB14_030030 [Gonioctena quinquepunctata]
MEQVLDIYISQLEIKDGERKRKVSGVPQQESNNEQIKNAENPRRSGRKRIRPAESVNRRVLSKPKKRMDDCNAKDIVNYYLDKKVKRLSPSLETIFEEPNSETIMSTRKFKRCINFPNSVCFLKNKFKIKKRAMKAKKVLSRPKIKMTMEMLFKKLSGIEENGPSVLK